MSIDEGNINNNKEGTVLEKGYQTAKSIEESGEIKYIYVTPDIRMSSQIIKSTNMTQPAGYAQITFQQDVSEQVYQKVAGAYNTINRE